MRCVLRLRGRSVKLLLLFAAVLGVSACAGTRLAEINDCREQSIDELQSAMVSGRLTSEALVLCYLSRIEDIDDSGTQLNSIIALNPDALVQARALDAERRSGHVRGPLHGIPILIKDNIETADPMPTTAGSLALAQNVTGRDALLVARL